MGRVDAAGHVAALQYLDAHPDVDVIVVARGGGNVHNAWGAPGDPAWLHNDPSHDVERLRGTALYLASAPGNPGSASTPGALPKTDMNFCRSSTVTSADSTKPAGSTTAVLGAFPVTADEARDLRHGKRLAGAADRLAGLPTATPAAIPAAPRPTSKPPCPSAPRSRAARASSIWTATPPASSPPRATRACRKTCSWLASASALRQIR